MGGRARRGDAERLAGTRQGDPRRVGARGDGRILAIRCETLANNGAYVTPYGRGSATGGFAAAVTGAYDIAAYHVAVKVIFTIP